MLISHPLGFQPPIISCACREVQFLPLGQNTYVLLNSNLLALGFCCRSVWAVSPWCDWCPPPQFPAGNQVAFWHVLLNPFWKKLSWGAGQICWQQHGWGCISLWISPWASARSSHCHSLLHLLWCIFPVHLLLCSLLTQCHIKHYLGWLNGGFRAALGPGSQGGTCWYCVPACWGALCGAPPWPLVMSKEVKEREGDALGLQVTAICSLDFVDADQCWHKHRIGEIGFEPNSLWKNSQGWCNGRSESALLNIRDRMTWMQTEPQPAYNPGS